MVYTHGINDASYSVTSWQNGKRVMCPFYKRWLRMLERCYCSDYQSKKPSYHGVIVCDEWLKFSNFKKWMESQDWENKELDKDLLAPGNKTYGPNKCLFVSSEVNHSLIGINEKRGSLPSGIYTVKNSNNYYVRCKEKGITHSLGGFKTIQEALKIYLSFKSKVLIRLAKKQKDMTVKNSLINYAEYLKSIDYVN